MLPNVLALTTQKLNYKEKENAMKLPLPAKMNHTIVSSFIKKTTCQEYIISNLILKTVSIKNHCNSSDLCKMM